MWTAKVADFLDGPGYVAKVRSMLEELKSLFSSKHFMFSTNQDSMYAVEKVLGYAEELFHHHPFRVGDIVEIVDPPAIDKNHGWYGSRHMFAEGNVCEVVGIDWHVPKKVYTIDIKFPNETWKSALDGQEFPVTTRAIFCNNLASRFKLIDRSKNEVDDKHCTQGLNANSRCAI